jgi:hypothetical protein
VTERTDLPSQGLSTADSCPALDRAFSMKMTKEKWLGTPLASLAWGCSFLALAAGCDAGGGGGEAFFATVRDSAGVRIVESFRPAWEEGGGWRLGTEPIIRLGVLEGDEAYQFHEVAGAVRLDDGTLVVADAGYREVRFFNPDGSVAAIAGGPGEGPEEFSGISAVGIGPEGLVWVYDYGLRRFAWLGHDGNFVGLTTLDPEPPTLNPLGPLSDGSFLLKQLWGSEVSDAAQEGLRRDPVAYVRFDSVGTLLDTLGLFPGRELYLFDEGGRGVMSTPPFAKNSVGATWGERVLVGSMDTFELEEYAVHGELVRILRIPERDLTVDADDREEYIQERLESEPPERRVNRRRELEAMPFPETRPAYGELVPDAAGNLWVGDWAVYPEVAERWTILNPDGEWLGDMVLPPGFFPTHIGNIWVLGFERDELDVEYVVLYPLSKDAGNG